MIEFEGGALLPVDASSTLMIALLAQANGEIAQSAGAPLGGDYGDDTVLREPALDAGDGWIASLLSGSSNDAAVVGTISPSGEMFPDRLSNDEGESEDIVITGRPLTGRVVTNGGDGDGTGEGSSDGSSGGGRIAGTPAVPVEEHKQDCGTDDGAAVQVARHVKGELPAGVSGPVDPVTTATGNDWSKVEFGTMIVRNPDGTFGALNDTIYSNDLNNYIQINYSTVQSVVGFWHSHPAVDSSSDAQLRGRYPSAIDWSTLARIAGGANGVSNPSLWIMDAFGTTRELKLDERAYFESLDDPQKSKVNGEGLEGKERAQSCG